MSRHIVDAFEKLAGIGIASATYDIVWLPPLTVAAAKPDGGTG